MPLKVSRISYQVSHQRVLPVFFILPAASVTGGAILPHTTCLGTRLGTSRGTPWHPIFRVSAVDFAKPFILFWAPQHKISGFRA